MTEGKTPPLPPPDAADEKLWAALVPKIVRLTTKAGQVYEVGKPYVGLDKESGYRQIDAKVTRIVELPDPDEGSSLFVVRLEGPGLPSGQVGHERVSSASVSDVGERWAEPELDKEEEAELDDPETGPDVLRVVQPIGGGALAIVHERGARFPEMPAPWNGIRGEIVNITRTPENLYRVRLKATPTALTPPGTVLTVTIFDTFSALEALSAEEADQIEAAAQKAVITALQKAVNGEDYDGDDDGEEEDDDDDDSDEPGP